MPRSLNGWKRLWLALPILVGVAAVAFMYWAIGCPIRYFTGVCCPGCGMTRAVWSALCLDFPSALHYHPLVFLLPFAALFLLFQKKIPRRLFYAAWAGCIAAFLGVYLFRLLSGSQVVYARPEEGVLFRWLTH